MKKRKVLIIAGLIIFLVVAVVAAVRFMPHPQEETVKEDVVLGDTNVIDRRAVDDDTVSREKPKYDDHVVANSIYSFGKSFEIMYWNHVITGQKAKKRIIGKFDGIHTDTLYIDSKENKHPEDGQHYSYYLKSRSGRLPKVELYGCDEMQPLIYEEGDLDGNGTDEVGYLPTWVNSQWRHYNILTFHKSRWMYLFSETEECFDTPQFFRCSGHEIARPGKRKGTVRVTYMTEGMNVELKDTVLRPTLTKIKMPLD